MNPTRLPLTVIGGFLGAGKTTLLNHWLRHAGGQRLAVLVNDFGALNIDAALIAANGGDPLALVELSNGCVCCQIGDDLSVALIRILETPGRFDAVVIEASGVSDPWRIAQLGRADPGLALDGVIVLVDAGSVQSQWRDPLLADTIERQLRAADLVVVNKIDLAASDARAGLHGWIASLAGPVPQFETVDAHVPLALLSSAALATAGADEARVDCGHGHAHDKSHDHDHDDDEREQENIHEHVHAHAHSHRAGAPDHGALFETWSCRPERAFDPAALRVWLRSTPSGLLRLKGVLRTGGPGDGTGWSELQFAGRHGALRRASEPQGGAALVAIGLRGRLPTALLDGYFTGPPRPAA